MISANFNQVINLILKPRERENNFALKEARKIWADSGDAVTALNILKKGRKDRTVEGKLLYGLTKCHKNDEVGSLDFIPRQQRLLYCHAYQSFLWNQVVSRRIRKYGTAVLAGDLVWKSKDDMGDNDSEQRSKEELIDYVADAEAHTIHDILIPIPGCKVKFPQNEMKTWFEELLAKDQLTMESFVSSVKTYNLPGDYRNMLVRPWDVSWQVVDYNDASEDLIVSDKEVMESSKDVKKEEEVMEILEDVVSEKEVTEGTKEVKEEDVEDAQYKAFILKMSLPSSCYATMALREILRVETDKHSMIRLNKDSSLVAKEDNKRVSDNVTVDEQ